MNWKELVSKKIYVHLFSGRIYSGIVQEVNYLGRDEFGIEMYMILIKDKFNLFAGFTTKEIKYLQEDDT